MNLQIIDLGIIFEYFWQTNHRYSVSGICFSVLVTTEKQEKRLMRVLADNTSPSIYDVSAEGLYDDITEDMVGYDPYYGYDLDIGVRYVPSLVDTPMHSSDGSTDSGESDEFHLSETTELLHKVTESLNTNITDLPFVSKTISNSEDHTASQSITDLEEATQTTTDFRSTDMDRSEGISTISQEQPFQEQTNETRVSPDGNKGFITARVGPTDVLTGDTVENVDLTPVGRHLLCTGYVCTSI